jgi:hypothetical protein
MKLQILDAVGMYAVILMLVLSTLCASQAHSACHITIDAIETPDESASPLTVIIKGTVTDCGTDSMVYSISCRNGQKISRIVSLKQLIPGYVRSATNHFSITVGTDADCHCDEEIQASAYCKGQEYCSGVLNRTIPCPDGCPEVQVEAHPGDCVAGQITVALAALDNAPNGPRGRWSYGDGSGTSDWFDIPESFPAIDQHTYTTPGTYTAKLEVENCPTEQVTFDLQDCGNCADVQISTERGPCDRNRSITFDIEATITAVGDHIRAALRDDADGNGLWNQLDVAEGDNSVVLTATVTYPTRDEDYPIRVDVYEPCRTSHTNLETVHCKSVPSDHGPEGGKGICNCSSIDVKCWVCCVIWGIFIAGLLASLILLARASCGLADWLTVGIVFGITLVAAGILIFWCGVDLCVFMFDLAIVNSVGWALICGTNLVVPASCQVWICRHVTIPLTGGRWVSGYLIGILLLWLIWLLLCKVL